MLGVFGGSGFYELFDDAEEHEVDTPYGSPSSPISVGDIAGTQVAFLARHGLDHDLPPHLIPYRANVWAMRELGVERIIAPSAVGSLHEPFAPGHLVIADQLVDRTWGRESTFYDGPVVEHLAFADPYCEQLRPLAAEAARTAGATVHEGATIVVIQGPRFSTRAESAWFASAGWELLNMTQLPEATLTREKGMCYVNLSVVTDYDVGVPGEVEPVTHAEVLRQFAASIGTLKDTIRHLVPMAADTRTCNCSAAAGGDGG